MRRTIIFKALLLFLTGLFLSFTALLFAFPKAILIDRLLSRQGVFLFPERVEEGLSGVLYERVRVFYGSEEVAQFDNLKLNLYPAGLHVRGVCKGGELFASFNWKRKLTLESKDFRCSGLFKRLEGRLSVSEGVSGRVSLEGLRVKGIEVDTLNLSFRGNNFEGSVGYMGMTLKGGGRVELNARKPEETRIDASFKGEVGTLFLKGSLRDISVHLR